MSFESKASISTNPFEPLSVWPVEAEHNERSSKISAFIFQLMT